MAFKTLTRKQEVGQYMIHKVTADDIVVKDLSSFDQQDFPFKSWMGNSHYDVAMRDVNFMSRLYRGVLHNCNDLIITTRGPDSSLKKWRVVESDGSLKLTLINQTH